MLSSNRDILVLLKHESVTEEELERLHQLLHFVESPVQFCRAHELVDRNYITSKPEKILKETRGFALRAFRFLINKN